MVSLNTPRSLEGSSHRQGRERSIKWSLSDEPDRTGLGLAASLEVLDIHIFVASKREGYFTMSHTVTMSWVRSSQRSLWLPTAKL